MSRLVGHAKLELYKCLGLFKSASVNRLVLIFLRIVQVPESVAGFATLVAVIEVASVINLSKTSGQVAAG